MRYIGILLLGFQSALLAQTIYTWTDEHGTKHFSTSPPPTQSVQEAELGKEAASGLGGNLPTPSSSSTGSAIRGGTVSSGLTYQERQEIERLKKRAQRQGIPKNLARFYEREIERIEKGELQNLTPEKQALRQKHLNLLAREFISPEELKESISTVDSLYKKPKR